MIIAKVREKCKTFTAKIPRDLLIFLTIVLASLLSFGFGYLSGYDAAYRADIRLDLVAPAGAVFASKNGTKYYADGCPGSDRVSELNKIWFTSARAAENAGYTAAAGC